MRLAVIGMLLALGACGEESAPKPKAPPPAAAVQPGQWESTLQVTNMRALDQGRPKLDMPVGTRVESQTCLAQADVARPSPELFVGGDFDCEYTNFYMRNGRINGQMVCRHPRVPGGDVGAVVDGSFTETGFEGIVHFSTALVSDGDVSIATRMTGRRTGDCTPGAESEGNKAASR